MQEYELEVENIIDWAINQANYEDLEKVAKALYAIYVMQRKREHPEDHRANRQLRRKFTGTGEYRPKKKDKWQKKRVAAERQLALNAKKFL